MGDTSQVPSPFSTRVNSVFSILARLRKAIICLETLRGPLQGIVLVVQVHEIVFTPANLPRRAVFRDALPIFVSCYLFDVPLFLENTVHYFFINVIGITQRLTSLMKPFYSTTPFDKSHFKVFWGSF